MNLTILIPCLNEADTLRTCIRKAKKALSTMSIQYEILVADNGSTDKSLKICTEEEVSVINVSQKGYGSALKAGISVAKGKYIIMGDADDSYDFLDIPRFYEQLIQGYTIVQGCRLPAGGGKIKSGAMPWSHKYIGNPLFSFLARWWFKAPIHDIYCGLRGFSTEYIKSLSLQSNGMEFATEMLIKASLLKTSIKEIPITLHKDGRITHPPHLKTFRDGWRTLRFFILYAPVWIFLVPGLLLTILTGVVFFGSSGGYFEMVWTALAINFTFFFYYLFLLSQIYIAKDGLIPPTLNFRYKLEHGLILGAITCLIGLGFITNVPIWAAILISLGLQIIAGSFFASMLGEASFKKTL